MINPFEILQQPEPGFEPIRIAARVETLDRMALSMLRFKLEEPSVDLPPATPEIIPTVEPPVLATNAVDTQAYPDQNVQPQAAAQDYDDDTQERIKAARAMETEVRNSMVEMPTPA